MGMMCSRDRAALPTGQPQKTQFDHPGLFGALPRPEFCDILGRDSRFLRMTKERRLAFRSLRSWAIAVL
jgi:hypothetical protein